MRIEFTKEEEKFREEIAGWLKDNLKGEFLSVIGRGGSGDQVEMLNERIKWEQHMGKAGWTCIGWPTEFGGKSASINEQVIFYEEYTRAGGPGRIGHIGETLAGPTIIAFGTKDQQQRFLPNIRLGKEYWCQGYSEPSAGSDLSAVKTKAESLGGKWVVNGQKIWTSLAKESNWIFALCRTKKGSVGREGLSYLLIPMDQSGISVRPIKQMTGQSEFNEVFFDNAESDLNNVVGEVGNGWKVAMGTLGFERGASTLGQQMAFEQEFMKILNIAKENGSTKIASIRQQLSEAWIGLKIMRFNALRMLSNSKEGLLSREAMLSKLYWATWHRNLGKLAMDVLGMESEIGDKLSNELSSLQKLFLFTRSDTIYAGTNQIQRNIISERALGMPKEPRGKKE
ncbi:uncharacterized protein METZ01_LOCUS95043 [marine metagenome]|uniref:Acyl-CoA dehydrogenase n=1 Tax=marine metagenome TaxID=408172 RepID=A0A381VPE6_9ZZZZ|tara:strand:- start:705 stop:1895 length:1191 start_codon:yes stop_codon:yes gene_type:complete